MDQDAARPGEPARSDDALIAAARAGNLDAFNVLVLRHQRVMFSVCLRMLRNPRDAEDATQDAFVRAWTGIQGYRGGSAKAWLLKIAINRCYDLLRAHARHPAGSLDAELFELEPIWSTQALDTPPELAALQDDLGIYLERALHQLPADQRATVILSDIHGCTHEEIAEITGAARGTVKSRLSRARARLRQMLSDDPRSVELFDHLIRLYEDPENPVSTERDPEAAPEPDMTHG